MKSFEMPVTGLEDRCPTCGQDTAVRQKPGDRPRADRERNIMFCVKCGENWEPGVGVYRP